MNTRSKYAFPREVDDLAVALGQLKLENIALVRLMHCRMGGWLIGWGLVFCHNHSGLCGPIALPAAKQMATLLGDRLQWISHVTASPLRRFTDTRYTEA